MELVRDANTPFPVLPTTDLVPCLTLVDEITTSSVGGIYKAKLWAPWDTKVSEFIIKVVDCRMRSHNEYKNAFLELLKEYENYYVFGQLKRDNVHVDVIERTTPTCYGLYKARKSVDVFALVIEYAGQVIIDRWKGWELSEKYVYRSLRVL